MKEIKWFRLILSVLVISFALCGCGKSKSAESAAKVDIPDHEDNTFRERKERLIKQLSGLQRITSTILQKWGPRAEERAHNQAACREMLSLASMGCEETRSVISVFKNSLEYIKCPDECRQHLLQKIAVELLDTDCMYITERTKALNAIDRLNRSIGEKTAAEVTGNDRKLIEELDKSLTHTLETLQGQK